MKISDFQSKDVINIVDGKKLGHISDIELDLRQGKIDSIVIPQVQRMFGIFGTAGSEIVIPWR
ncbi:MAG TPA: YlmC/YmxH family sporulation protein, partial [Candidatus Paenibacillus intestinavium]|nr:YlmC/YmxH family sporulation protein [Candidatus Paenibacillus intestinavium]